MSTKITIIFNNVKTLVGTLFSTRTKLPDAYILEANPDILLKNGYGIAWNDGDVNDELTGPSYFEERNISIILTARVARLDTNTSAMEAIELALLEDRNLLINQIKKSMPFDIGAEYFEYVSDDGILSVVDEKQNIKYLKINFTIRYQEVVS